MLLFLGEKRNHWFDTIKSFWWSIQCMSRKSTKTSKRNWKKTSRYSMRRIATRWLHPSRKRYLQVKKFSKISIFQKFWFSKNLDFSKISIFQKFWFLKILEIYKIFVKAAQTTERKRNKSSWRWIGRSITWSKCRFWFKSRNSIGGNFV